MTAEELLDACRRFPDAFVDYPLDDPIAVARRRSNRKWFAVLLDVHGRVCVNLKCEPERAELYRRVYQSVTPGWHMNKTHWNTVALKDDVPDQELLDMLAHSYGLVGPKRKPPRQPPLQFGRDPV